MSTQTSGRMAWLDACRVFAALGVVLIHCTADRAGLPYGSAAPAERIAPMLLRAVAELSGSELFFLISLFLLARGVDQKDRPYAEIVATQAKRLLVPFVAWSFFYTAFRLFKADAMGYVPGLLDQLSHWQSWVGYFALGTAQYHLHFLPTLFAIVLFVPLMKSATRFPIIGIAILPMIFLLDSVQGYIWGHATDPLTRDYLLRIVKIACYTGYGLVAFSLCGLFKRKLPAKDWATLSRTLLFGVGLAMMAKLTYTSELIATGHWGVRPAGANLAHFLIPVLVFAAFMAARGFAWSPLVHHLAKYTFGVFLLHPIFIDIYDVATVKAGFSVNPGVDVIAKWLFAVPASFALAYAISISRPCAWLIGLGPLPSFRLLSGAPARKALLQPNGHR